jgi:predicted ATP-grasp superfamily ATP-dependent carboligase
MDENAEPLFHFTKRVIRRFPAIHGPACCHVTDWIPELIPISLRLFRHVGLRGLANVEFKRDPRDGQLKLIECNARFTAANCLVAESGFDLASFVYNRLTGKPQEPLQRFQVGKKLWYPYEDFLAYRELAKKRELSFGSWLSSRGSSITPYFRWDDPLPTLATELRNLRATITRRVREFVRARCSLRV